MSGILNVRGIRYRYTVPMLAVTGVLLLPVVRGVFSASGWRWVHLLALSFSLSFCLTPIFRWVAFRFQILDMPADRKVHLKATPLLGGAAVFLAFSTSLLVNGIFTPQVQVILAAAAALFAIGLADDIRDIPALAKLAVQVLCTLLVMKSGVVLRVFPDPTNLVSQTANAALTLAWVLGITNAMNFFDGMDGMASGLGVIISFFLGVVAFQTDQPFLGWISVAMMGSCIGFLPYNLFKRRRATIFLGDAGSTVIGFILACIAVYGDWAHHQPLVAIASPLLIFWVLIFDMVHITAERILSGKVKTLRQWVEYVGKDHLHHRIAIALGSQKKSVAFIYLLNTCLGISAVVLRYARPLDAILLLVQAVGIVTMVTILERYGRKMAGRRRPDP